MGTSLTCVFHHSSLLKIRLLALTWEDLWLRTLLWIFGLAPLSASFLAREGGWCNLVGCDSLKLVEWSLITDHGSIRSTLVELNIEQTSETMKAVKSSTRTVHRVHSSMNSFICWLNVKFANKKTDLGQCHGNIRTLQDDVLNTPLFEFCRDWLQSTNHRCIMFLFFPSQFKP